MRIFACSHSSTSGQHDGHLPFWLPSFVKLIMLLLHVLFAVAEINILHTIMIIIFTLGISIIPRG